MKKVLIALDYNPCSKFVAESGYEIAMAMRAEITILHVITDIAAYSKAYQPVMGFDRFCVDGPFTDPDEQLREAKGFLAAVIQYLDDRRIEPRVLEGKTADMILQFAAEWKADMIVMGEQSHNGLEKLLMGSVVSDVMRHSAIPLMIVPTAPERRERRKEYSFMHQYAEC
ncbi:MAG: universal stress protein [Terrimonas sp.]|nr:universal stress protein [Terrimonas sp.]